MIERFSLSVSPTELQRYYRGEAQSVVVLSDKGLRLQFPARLLRQFVKPEGVYGRFEIEYDPQGKLIEIRAQSGG
jgi:hypothetical protein